MNPGGAKQGARGFETDHYLGSARIAPSAPCGETHRAMEVDFDWHYLPSGLAALLVLAHVGATAALLVVVVRRALSHSRAARAWGATERAESPSLDRSGPALLRGFGCWVERDGGSPVRITVRQSSESLPLRGSQTVRWTEQNRECEARPFDLVLEGGRRVRVEAELGTLDFHSDFSETRFDSVNVRVREARLDDGTEVWVSGALDVGAPGAVHRALATNDGEHPRAALHPGADGRLRVFSEPPSSWHRRQLRFAQAQVAALVASFALVHGVGLFDAHRALFTGRAVTTELRGATTVAASTVGFNERGRYGSVISLCVGQFYRSPTETNAQGPADADVVEQIPVDWRACTRGAEFATGPRYVLRVSNRTYTRPGRFGTLRFSEFVFFVAVTLPTAWLLALAERRRRVASGERLDERAPVLTG